MKISVITVCYNSEKYIRDCIFSVNNQKLDDVEHIFVDGKSTDKTVDVIKKTSKRNPIIISEPDNGLYDAMNKGLTIANGELICFLNSDDLFASKDVLEVVYDSFKNTRKHVLWGDVNVVDQNNVAQILRKAKRDQLGKKEILVGTVPPHPSFFISKKILHSIGHYDQQYEVAADFDFMKRSLMCVDYDGLYISKLITVMRSGGFSNSNLFTTMKGNKEMINSLKTSYKEFNIMKFIFFRLRQTIREKFIL